MPINQRTLSRQANVLAQHIRSYVRLQQSAWRALPALAAQADGKTGYSEEYGLAYGHKLWPIDLPGHGRLGWVCLLTAKLLALTNTKREMPDEDVLRLATHLDLLDAHRLVASTTAEAQRPRAAYMDHADPRESRERLRALRQPATRGPVTSSYD